MVDREVFARRLARLEELLVMLRRLADGRRETYLHDPGRQAQAERWLHLAAECVLDLAHHLISDRGWRTPDTYREAVEVLVEHGVLSEELGEQMVRWAGLRNVLVHLYLQVDHAVVWEILQHDLDQLSDFARAVQRATR